MVPIGCGWRKLASDDVLGRANGYHWRHRKDRLGGIAASGVERSASRVVSRADILLRSLQVMSEELTTTRGPRPAPQANLGYLFRLAFQRFRTVLEEALEAFELTSQEYGILSLFETRSELSTSELARISQVTRQTMHTAVLGLERAGLVERRSKNRRVVLVGPTKRGRECLEAATERVRELEQAAFAGLTRDERRAVRNWLAGVATMASAAAEEARNAGTVSR